MEWIQRHQDQAIWLVPALAFAEACLGIGLFVSGLFLVCYGIFRFLVEFVRQPDPQLGYLAFDWLTMGQVLSAPMIAAGAALMFLAYRRNVQ